MRTWTGQHIHTAPANLQTVSAPKPENHGIAAKRIQVPWFHSYPMHYRPIHCCPQVNYVPVPAHPSPSYAPSVTDNQKVSWRGFHNVPAFIHFDIDRKLQVAESCSTSICSKIPPGLEKTDHPSRHTITLRYSPQCWLEHGEGG